MSRLALSDVTVRRSRRVVLDCVSVSFAPGRLTVVIGPNGAGKSTLLDVAAGLLPAASGTVSLDDRPLSSIARTDLARRRAYLPQNPRVDWAINVERVVALGLTALRDRPATELSGGELARVMLARATVSTPDILIVDEPTAGLDPRHALEAARHLRALADEGCTVIVALHDLDLVTRIADDVVAVRDGRIGASGPAASVLTEPVLGDLYAVAVRVRRDDDGTTIRFVG